MTQNQVDITELSQTNLNLPNVSPEVPIPIMPTGIFLESLKQAEVALPLLLNGVAHSRLPSSPSV